MVFIALLLNDRTLVRGDLAQASVIQQLLQLDERAQSTRAMPIVIARQVKGSNIQAAVNTAIPVGLMTLT
jgi:hypothetical protein